jgi:hypothetical protein
MEMSVLMCRIVVAGLDRADSTPRVVVGNNPSTVVNHTHTSIVFRVPPGESARSNLTVTVFGQTSNVVVLRRNPPFITELLDIQGAPLPFGDCCPYVFDALPPFSGACCAQAHLRLHSTVSAVIILCPSFFVPALAEQHQRRYPNPYPRFQSWVSWLLPPHQDFLSSLS